MKNINIPLYKVMGIIIIFISVIIMYFLIKNISNTFYGIIENKSQNIAINISNDVTSSEMENVSYTDLVNVERDDTGKVKLVQVNTILMNNILDEISNSLQEKMNGMQEQYIYLPLGSIFGNDIISNIGPKIKIKILPVADFSVNFKSEFVENGINQTIHRIYIIIDCDITIITPINHVTSKANNSILIGEVVIVGDVPQTYYNMEGIESIKPLDTLRFE